MDVCQGCHTEIGVFQDYVEADWDVSRWHTGCLYVPFVPEEWEDDEVDPWPGYTLVRATPALAERAA